MKNELVVILAYKRKTVADVHEATGIPLQKLTDIYYERTCNISTLDIVKICNYLNITTEELFGRRMEPPRKEVADD